MSANEVFLQTIGVAPLPPRLVPFDPGYDEATFTAHVQQSAHLLFLLKLSMATWLIAAEPVLHRKVLSAHLGGLRIVAGGGPFEIAVALDALDEYLDACAGVGFDRIEAGEGFAASALDPNDVLRRCRSRGLAVQFEMGGKFTGSFSSGTLDAELRKAKAWLDAGAEQIVVEAAESAVGIGLFDEAGQLNLSFVDRIVDAVGDLDRLQFEAPTKQSQFALLDHLGTDVILSNVRLEEILRVEIYRRGLHSKAFANDRLRPSPRRA
jgi:phosphosulfolactate synthase